LAGLSLADDAVHVALVVMCLIVLAVSVLAYVKKRNRRYLLLTLAFAFLTLSQSVDLVETFSTSSQLVIIPIIEIHLSHLFDFLMLTSFGLALIEK
jgi:uncharacterized membrane protein YoaK (UPF0700 family)